MIITLMLPSFDFRSAESTWVGLDKSLSNGRLIGFSYEDMTVRGNNKPITVILNKDPKTGEVFDPPRRAYVYKPGTPFASPINHPDNLGPTVKKLSIEKGRIDRADMSQGAVFTIDYADVNGEEWAYVVNKTALAGWQPQSVLDFAGDANQKYVGRGKTVYITEGCWWCHTLLPEHTQDWQVFGTPPYLGDFNGEMPTAFGSDRKAPDILHVASRNSSREWMMMHFFNPRLVQPNSIMPRFDYLWGPVDVNGKPIDFSKWRDEYDEYRTGQRAYPPEVPEYARDTEIRALIDWVLTSLK
ncbi:MAG TPA: cytochrome oxidase [Gammaproteobacteria bacterium]|nr:cytochrome oxidase [Gammaproteobacteria bacterium]